MESWIYKLRQQHEIVVDHYSVSQSNCYNWLKTIFPKITDNYNDNQCIIFLTININHTTCIYLPLLITTSGYNDDIKVFTSSLLYPKSTVFSLKVTIKDIFFLMLRFNTSFFRTTYHYKYIYLPLINIFFCLKWYVIMSLFKLNVSI